MAKKQRSGLEHLVYPQFGICYHAAFESERLSKRIYDFKTNSYIRVLVGTDLLSRGLDLPDVACVILTNLPGDTTNYVYRIGRTGRAGKNGLSYAFVEEKFHIEI